MQALVVPAAGRGSRFGSTDNKIWSQIGGRSLIEWALSPFEAHPGIDLIVIAGSRHDMGRLRSLAARFTKVHAVVEGGNSRQESVGNGLAALPPDCDVVLVHDAARPAASQELISRVLAVARRDGAAVPGIPISDTLKRVDEACRVVETVPRDGLWAVQTPQGARRADLAAAYDRLGARVAEATDEAGVLEAAGFSVTIVPGESSNIKVTHPADLDRAERILAAQRAAPGGMPSDWPVGDPPESLQDVRTGIGYDVHPFADGRPLWLGGVRLPHPRGLAGHSDADALLHAVCDALLGAAGLGDIGLLFPDTDSAHKDRPSIEFAREVALRVRQSGWRITNVDVSVLAEEPRLGPHRERMASVVADGLQLASSQVNIKATTAERMGFVGRREGIACWAIATIVR